MGTNCVPLVADLFLFCYERDLIISKGAKIRYQYNQVPHLTQDTNGKVTSSQLDTTNVSQEVSPFPAGDHKAHINRRAQRHSKHKTEQKHKRSDVIDAFNTTSRYLDDILNINNVYFDNLVS